MNQERKVSVLRNLLERVQKRAAAPHAAPGSIAVAAPAASATISAAPAVAPQAVPPLAISVPPAQPAAPSARPGSATLPLDFYARPEEASVRPSVHEAVTGPPLAAMASMADREASEKTASAFSEAPTAVPTDEDEGPPSAPRLRDAPEIEVAADEEEDEQEAEEREPQLKTPPPESGRQHVTPGPSIAVSEVEEDISITVTMEESETPPSVAPAVHAVPAVPEVSIPLMASRTESLDAPPPRLALVSEPEIELHGMTPLSSAIVEPIAPAKPPPTDPRVRPGSSPFQPVDIELAKPVSPVAPAAPPPPPALSVPAATPSGVRPAAGAPAALAPSAGAPSPAAPSIASPPESAPASPPVRLMAEPLGESGKPLPPVEVWASTFSPTLKGEVAAFVGHNADAGPKTFGDLVRASVALGEEKP